MRFSLAETMCDPTQYVPLAQAAEEAGFHAFTLPDSVAYPAIRRYGESIIARA